MVTISSPIQSAMLTFPEVFDSSMLSDFKSCPARFRLAYMPGAEWKAKEPSVHIHAGSAYAKGLEMARKAFYSGEYEMALPDPSGALTAHGTPKLIWTPQRCEPGNSDTAIAVGLQALLAAYGPFSYPPDSAKSAERMAGALEFYFTNYPLDHDTFIPITLPSGRRGIEISFCHPLPIDHPETGNPLLYCGRMDAVGAFAGGTFGLDDKTTTQLGSSWGKQWDTRAQFTGYCWGLREAGIKVDGFLIRGVSILKTKYDTLQPVTYRPEWQIDRWYNELLGWIEDIKLCWAKEQKGKHHSWRHNLDHACADYGGCSFRDICLSQNPQSYLETGFERRHWNPILREERKLIR
jgi:hypothetical protein